MCTLTCAVTSELRARGHCSRGRTLWRPPLQAAQRVDSVPVKIAIELNQPLFHFISAVDACLINGFFMAAYIWYSTALRYLGCLEEKIQLNKIWSFSMQQFDSFTSAMCRSWCILTNSALICYQIDVISQKSERVDIRVNKTITYHSNIFLFARK